MAEYYTLQVAGLTRKLKRCRISDKFPISWKSLHLFSFPMWN